LTRNSFPGGAALASFVLGSFLVAGPVRCAGLRLETALSDRTAMQGVDTALSGEKTLQTGSRSLYFCKEISMGDILLPTIIYGDAQIIFKTDQRHMKNAIRKILAGLGYEIRRAKGSAVPFENFANFAQVYEHSLNNAEELIQPNEMRPPEAYFIVQALAKCKDLPGDVCEFGVKEFNCADSVMLKNFHDFPV